MSKSRQCWRVARSELTRRPTSLPAPCACRPPPPAHRRCPPGWQPAASWQQACWTTAACCPCARCHCPALRRSHRGCVLLPLAHRRYPRRQPPLLPPPLMPLHLPPPPRCCWPRPRCLMPPWPSCPCRRPLPAFAASWPVPPSAWASWLHARHHPSLLGASGGARQSFRQ